MAKVSVLIPARNELFLPQTVADILAKATGEIEVIAILDGYWPVNDAGQMLIPDDPRVKLLHRGRAWGMRAALNAAAAMATGEWLMKLDAHCLLADGFDEVLKADCDRHWIVIPRRKRLDAENWCVQDVGKPDVDYEYLSWPYHNPGPVPGMHGTIWNERIRARLGKPEYDIDENMSFQGSCWFMHREHWAWLGGMSEDGYGTFIQESQEIGLKTWLSGVGQVMVNKRTWYAHLHKGKKYGRMYFFPKSEVESAQHYTTDYWMNNRWGRQTYDLDWLVERFWPVPTWPEDRGAWRTSRSAKER